MQRIINLIKSSADHIRFTHDDFIHLEGLIEREKTDKLLNIGTADHDYFVFRHRREQSKYIEKMKSDIKQLRNFLDALENKLNELEPIVAKEAEEYYCEQED